MPIDRNAGRAIYALGGEAARTWPSMSIRARLVTVEGERERVLGEYTFEHTAYA